MDSCRPRIGLFGTFDLKNYGDLLFPDVFRFGIRKFLPEAETVLFSPVGGTKPFSNGEVVHSLLDLDRVHEETPLSAIVIGGGELVRLDATVVSDRRRYGYPGRPADLWAAPILFGHAHGIPVLFNAPGVSFDFQSEVWEPVLGLLRLVRYLSVRDDPSRNALLRMDPGLDVSVVPDTVALYPECISADKEEAAFRSARSKTDLPSKFALFQINRFERGLSERDYVSELERLEAATGCPVLLFPIGYVHRDIEFLERISEASHGRFRMLGTELSPEEMFAVIGRATCFVGTSMHGCSTAMMRGVPTVGINWGNAKKMRGCFESYGMSPNLVRSISAFSGDMLKRLPPAGLPEALKERVWGHFRLMAGLIGSSCGESHRGDGDMALYMSLLSSLQSSLPARGSVFFDLGEGFSEENAKSVDIEWKGRSFLIVSELSLPLGCRRIRIDPAERQNVAVDEVVVFADNGKAVSVSDSNGMSLGHRWVFPLPDPWLSFELPPDCRAVKLRLSGSVATNQDLVSASALLHARERRLRADNWKCTEEKNRLRSRNAGLSEEISKLRGRNESLSTEMQKLRGRNESLSTEISKLRGRNESLSTECVLLRERNRAVQSESILRRDYIVKLSGQLVESRENAGRLGRKVAGLSGQLRSAIGELDAAKGAIRLLESRNDQLRRSMTWRAGSFVTWAPRRLSAMFNFRLKNRSSSEDKQ